MILLPDSEGMNLLLYYLKRMSSKQKIIDRIKDLALHEKVGFRGPFLSPWEYGTKNSEEEKIKETFKRG